jgi:DNA-binding winged helix-turn-helix (wHTH) protein/Tfp pilus assembly protein PilF
MHRQARQSYEFGPFRLDPSERTLRRGDQPVPLQPKLFETLCALVERSGHLVEKDEMLKIVWPDAFVEEGSLTRAVSRLRQILETNDGDGTYIETIPKVGYRFVAAVRAVPHDVAEPTVEDRNEPEAVRSIEESAAPSRRLARVAIFVGVSLLIIAIAALALRQARAPQSGPATEAHSLAILPFEPGDPSSSTEEKLGAEVAAELASRFQLTHVVLRPASDKSGADWRLEGTIRQQPGHDVYSVRLLEAKGDRARWSKDFESGPGDPLSAANTISIGLAEALGPELSAGDREALEDPHSDRLDAYQLVMKGRLAMSRGGKGALQAGDYFELAIQKDPSYALAYASLADLHSTLFDNLVISFAEGAEDARRNALKAVELDGISADAHLSLAVVHERFDWDWSAADREFRRALELRPNDAGIHSSRGVFENEIGRFDDALRELQKARVLNPTSPWIPTLIGETLRRAGRSDEAIEELQKAIAMDPALGAPHYKLGLLYEERGKYETAIAEFLRCLDLYGIQVTADAVRKANEQGGPMSAYRAWLERCQLDSEIKAVRIAQIDEVLGQPDRALDALEVGFEKRSAGISSIGSEPTLTRLRTDSRFQTLLTKLNLPARAL